MNAYKKITKLSPFIASQNLGDYIIDDYCSQILNSIFEDSFNVVISTADRLSELSRSHIATADYSFVCGTNLLASHMNKNKLWNVSIADAIRIFLCKVPRKSYLKRNVMERAWEQHKVILFGVGWWQYQDAPDFYTKALLKMMLSPKYLHAVRDSYTQKMMNLCGFENVINTACPTMWKLTPEHCKRIPQNKAKEVVTTLTSYNTNPELDDYLLKVLLSQYEKVYVWLQAIEDYDQIQNSPYADKVVCIAPTLKAYDAFLRSKEVDYIGTRLHGGIRALNYGKRALIIGVDNRAIEISKDTDLPVIPRDDIEKKLEKMLRDGWDTNIRLPQENIDRWKKQFMHE